MVGASKLNKNDVQKIRHLFTQGLNDCEIARQFIPESGQQVSREHIQRIRHGHRWNLEKNSFIMKDHLNDLPVLKTQIGEYQIETQVGWLKTKTLERWFFLTLVNDIEVNGPYGHLMEKKPSKGKILRFHNQFISMYL